jgi:hypothetical protein
LLLAALVSAASCGGGGGLEAPHLAPLETSAWPFTLVTVGIGNPVKGEVLTARWETGMPGSTFSIATPVFPLGNGTPGFRVAMAPGVAYPASPAFFEPGNVTLYVTRTVGGNAATAKASFEVLELPPPQGAQLPMQIGTSFGGAIRSIVHDWIGTEGTLEAFHGKSLHVDSILTHGASDSDKLQALAETASELPGVLGAAGGSLAIFDLASLALVDRVARGITLALAGAKQSAPPSTLCEYATFYQGLDTDAHTDRVRKYLEITRGAATMLTSALERATVDKAEQAPFLAPHQLGGLAWGSAASFGLAAELLPAVLAGQAVAGQPAFDAIDDAATSHASSLGGIAEDHSLLSVSSIYGPELKGIFQSTFVTMGDVDTLRVAIALGFNLQFYPWTGIPEASVSEIELSESILSGGEYWITAKATGEAGGSVQDAPIVLFVVSSEGAIDVFSAATDGSGIATFGAIPVDTFGTAVMNALHAGSPVKAGPLVWSGGILE